MNAFRYQAIESSGTAVQGVIEAEDRRSALQLLGSRGLCPSLLEPVTGRAKATEAAAAQPAGRVPRRWPGAKPWW